MKKREKWGNISASLESQNAREKDTKPFPGSDSMRQCMKIKSNRRNLREKVAMCRENAKTLNDTYVVFRYLQSSFLSKRASTLQIVLMHPLASFSALADPLIVSPQYASEYLTSLL